MHASTQGGYARTSVEQLLFHNGNVHTARVVSYNQTLDAKPYSIFNQIRQSLFVGSKHKWAQIQLISVWVHGMETLVNKRIIITTSGSHLLCFSKPCHSLSHTYYGK